MPSAVRLREDYSTKELRGLARRCKDQSEPATSVAGCGQGWNGPRIGGMDRQTLRDWVHRFNASGPEGLIDNWTDGPKPRLSAEQLAQFAQVVDANPPRVLFDLVLELVRSPACVTEGDEELCRPFLVANILQDRQVQRH